MFRHGTEKLLAADKKEDISDTLWKKDGKLWTP